MHAKKIVSFSDNINEQLRQHVEEGTSIANVNAEESRDTGSMMPPPATIGKWFRTLSYDNTINRSLREEKNQENQNVHGTPIESKAKPNESTPKFNMNLNKSPVSMTSKYQSVLSINHDNEMYDAKKTTKLEQKRRSTSLDSLSRKKLNKNDVNARNNKNTLTDKVTSSAKLNTSRASQSSKIFNLDAIKHVLLGAKSKALNSSNNNGPNTSFKEKVLNNSLVNNIKSLAGRSQSDDDDGELHQTLIDNIDTENNINANEINDKRDESGEQILPQSKM